MLAKTAALVLGYVPFRETSVIIRMYTEVYGIQSYIENGVRSAKSKNKIALLQPLTLLDLVVYHDDRKSLHRFSEIKCLIPYSSLPFMVTKSAIGLFITEILAKTLHEENGNLFLFRFLTESLLWLDNASENFENFHLQFLLQYSTFLGVSPQNTSLIFSELHELGIYLPNRSQYEPFMHQLLHTDYGCVLPISRTIRYELLDILLQFFSIHTEGFTQLRSLAILKETLK